MNFKLRKKALSFILAVIMLMSATAVTFVNADTVSDGSVATPKSYDTAADGEKLYDVDFSSEYYTHFDDSEVSFDNGGKTYDANGMLRDNAKGMWDNSLTNDAKIIEEDGAALRINDKVTGFEDPSNGIYIAPGTDDVLGANSTFVGKLNGFTLENKTYSLEFELFKRGMTQATVFFGNGTFYNFGGCDVNMPNLGLQINNSSYSLMRQLNKVSDLTIAGLPTFTTEPNGDTTLGMKIVLSGGAVIENTTLYDGSWTTPKNGVATWFGDVVPVNFDIYASYVTEHGPAGDVPVASGVFYQPADVPVVFGIGETSNLTANQYYGVRDLAIYKGDTYVPYDINFAEAYDDIDYGSELFTFDGQGIVNPNNSAVGYDWNVLGGALAFQNGELTINSDKDITHGAYTPSPLGKGWDTGYYEMEMTVNNMQTFKIGLISVGDDERIGFNLLPNGTAESFGNFTNDEKAYLSAEGDAANMWISADDGIGEGVINNDAIKTVVHDKFVAGSGEEPEDPRMIRDYGAGKANVKIAYNCENNIITLYERVGGDWFAISSIDYNGAVERGYEIFPVLDFTAYYKNANIVIRGISIKKGLTAACLYYYRIEGFESSKVLTDYQDGLIDTMTAKYVEEFGLEDLDIAWTSNGRKVIDDYKEHYESIEHSSYAPEEVNLAPVVDYDDWATDAVLRGVQFAKSDNATGNYNVRFIAALGDVSEVSAIKFDVVKKVGNGDAVKSTIDVTTVSKKLSANGITMNADLIGGSYVAAASLKNEVAAENVTVTYEVSVSTVAIDGTVTKGNTVTYSFINGEYVGALD